ncbi:ubiquitin carboxyl-terminal hydrolase 51-like [Dorcoceras hygrometricum]|uniref:Ubiquitin carboxyl-terminal hydrolase 51-like n=1 Tax=Dorcoceras hygrometricum TaxID=472368 RepID=A0A2Z7D0Q9_9LAMI|nr:ubiquitin carboxyl-terminal hydrolase 51-like [Dorcoceras hygrometricum]
MVKRLATSSHDPLGITDSACKNQSVMVSVQYGPFNTYIPIRSTTIGKSRVARDPITMHTSRRSNSDIMCVTRRAMNPRQRSIESYVDPNRVGKWVKVRHLSRRVSMTFRVVRANLYNQDLGLIHSTNGNYLESTNEGSSVDHQKSRRYRTVQVLRASSTRRSKAPNWYQSKSLRDANPTPPNLVQTAA